MFIYLFIYSSIYLFVCLFIYLFIHSINDFLIHSTSNCMSTAPNHYLTGGYYLPPTPVGGGYQLLKMRFNFLDSVGLVGWQLIWSADGTEGTYVSNYTDRMYTNLYFVYSFHYLLSCFGPVNCSYYFLLAFIFFFLLIFPSLSSPPQYRAPFTTASSYPFSSYQSFIHFIYSCSPVFLLPLYLPSPDSICTFILFLFFLVPRLSPFSLFLSSSFLYFP